MGRDVIGAINTGLKYLSPDGSPVALGSTEPHEVWVKQMNPHQGLTPLTELKVLKISKSTVRGETLGSEKRERFSMFKDPTRLDCPLGREEKIKRKLFTCFAAYMLRLIYNE